MFPDPLCGFIIFFLNVLHFLHVNDYVLCVLCMTLLKIEVLGVSLPWMGIFTKNRIGAEFINHLQEIPEKSNPVHGSDMNNSGNHFLHDSCPSFDHETFSSKGNAVEYAKKSAVSHGIDLLTGDLLFSDSTSQPDGSCVTDDAVRSSGNIIDFFDNSSGDHQFQDSNLPVQPCVAHENTHSIAQCYIHIFKSLSTYNKVSWHFPFPSAMIYYNMLHLVHNVSLKLFELSHKDICVCAEYSVLRYAGWHTSLNHMLLDSLS